MKALSQRQRERLFEAHDGSQASNPGTSYLADAGFGMRAARTWYQTFQSLAERGLVRYTGQAGAASYTITAEGRRLVAELRGAS